jgi:hypothetical protein
VLEDRGGQRHGHNILPSQIVAVDYQSKDSQRTNQDAFFLQLEAPDTNENSKDRWHRSCGLNQSADLNASAATIPDGYLFPLDDDRYLALPIGLLEHLIHVLLVFLDVDVVMRFIGRPGPFRIRSTGLPVNNHFPAHDRPSFLINYKINKMPSFDIRHLIFRTQAGQLERDAAHGMTAF